MPRVTKIFRFVHTTYIVNEFEPSIEKLNFLCYFLTFGAKESYILGLKGFSSEQLKHSHLNVGTFCDTNAQEVQGP